MYYELTPITEKPEKTGWYYVTTSDKMEGGLLPKMIYYKHKGNEWDNFSNIQFTHYLRPVVPTPDAEAAAMKKYPIEMCRSLPIDDQVIEFDGNEEPRDAFIEGHTHAMMSKQTLQEKFPDKEAQTIANRYTMCRYNTPNRPDGISNHEYFHGLKEAIELYALAKCREAQEEIVRLKGLIEKAYVDSSIESYSLGQQGKRLNIVSPWKEFKLTHKL